MSRDRAKVRENQRKYYERTKPKRLAATALRFKRLLSAAEWAYEHGYPGERHRA